MKPILLFLILPTVIHGCLVVRSPKCECSSMALDSSNIQATVGSHNFYKNVSGSPITAPKINIEDCSISMYCEGEGKSLVVFDMEEAAMFGAYSADGFCDASTQSWLIDDGSEFKSYKRLYGACVQYTPTPPKKCPCNVELINTGYIEGYMTEHPAYRLISWFESAKPNVTLDDHGCIVESDCGNGEPFVVSPTDRIIMRNMTYSCDHSTHLSTLNLTKKPCEYGPAEYETVVSPTVYLGCNVGGSFYGGPGCPQAPSN